MKNRLMMEPWKIKSDDTRKVDSKVLFIIFCEDGAVEPAYFELFKSDNIQISAFGNTNQHHDQVDYATEHFRKNDLIETTKEGNEILKIDDGAQVWCVFDRDKEDNDGKDTAFNDSITAAQAKGIKTAWSNDDFELWVLLHFEDVDPTDQDYFHRDKYYERLTDILKILEPNNPLFQNPKFDYYNTMKSKKRFLQITYQHMKGNVGDAINRAEQLEAKYIKNPTPPHAQCPCTLVHHLVKELINEK